MKRFDKLKKIMKKSKHIEAHLTGTDAEDFVARMANKIFLDPFVFKNPKCSDGDEFSDVVVLFRDILILFEVKGNKFDPKNPQRYLKESKKRHQQLVRARNIVQGNSKKVLLENDYFSFSPNFEKIRRTVLISVAAGRGEMEVAYDLGTIDYSNMNSEESGKYLGFLNLESDIHSFTLSELEFASNQLDTIKDFLWYLDFEKKYLQESFSENTETKRIHTLLDVHREDLIAQYVFTYYCDEYLHVNGEVILDEIFGSVSIPANAKVIYSVNETKNYFFDDERYKLISEERRESFIWEKIVESLFIDEKSDSKTSLNNSDLMSLLETMAWTSRFERYGFSRRIKTIEENKIPYVLMCPVSKEIETLFLYSAIESKDINDTNLESIFTSFAYDAWCKINFGDKFLTVREKFKNTLLIARIFNENETIFKFGFLPRIEVDEIICKQMTTS